jgi:hypothetical protein
MAPHPAWEPTEDWPEEDARRPFRVDELPAGVEALLPDGDENQALFFIRRHQTLVTGDIFSNTGGFHVFVDEQDREPFLAWLPRLSELPVERVLVAHGEPVLSGGAARVRDAVAEARAIHA